MIQRARPRPRPTASVGAARAGPKGPRPGRSQTQGPAAPTEAVGPRAQIILLFVLLGYYFRLFPYQRGREIVYFFSGHL